MKKCGSTFGVTLLVAGTSIGSNFIGIPVFTGIAGFIPACLISILIWFFMLANGYLYLEAALACPPGANIPTMGRLLLGKTGMIIAVALFVLNLYTYLITYFTLGASLVSYWVLVFFNLSLPLTASMILLGGVITLILWVGIRLIVALNTFSMLALFSLLAIIIFFAVDQLTQHFLFRQSWIYIFFALPILFAALTYQFIIPSFVTYLNRDVKKLKRSLLLGSLIALLTFIIWQGVVIGTVSQGNLWLAYEHVFTIKKGYTLLEGHPILLRIQNGITFFALFTSFLGFGLSFVDFGGDLFKVPEESRVGKKRFYLCLLAMLPPLVIAILMPKAPEHHLLFVISTIGQMPAISIVPLIMVISARAHKLSTQEILPGKKPMLFLIAVVVFFSVYINGVVLIQ